MKKALFLAIGFCLITALNASAETGDSDPPALMSFTRQVPSVQDTNADTLVFRATFSEGVKNVTESDFVVSGTSADIASVTQVSPDVYDLTVSGGDLDTCSGTVGLDLAADQDIADLSDNPLPTGEPAVDETYELDNTPPTNPTLDCTSHTAGTWSSNDYIQFYDYTTSSDAGSGVDGYQDHWSTSPTWTPSQVKDMEENVLNTGANRDDGEWYYHIATVDNAGNWAVHDTYGPYQIDTVAPSAPDNLTPSDGSQVNTLSPVLSWDSCSDGGSGLDGSEPYRVEIVGPENTLAYRTTATSTTPTLPGDGTYTWRVSSQDDAGNDSAWSSLNTLHADTTKPNVTIDLAQGQADPTNESPVVFVASFDEEIDIGTFSGSDVVIGGTAATGDPGLGWVDLTSYSISIPVTNDGTVTVSIPAGVVEDFAGNLNTSSTNTDNEITFDTTAPQVVDVTVNDTLLSDADAGSGTFDVTIRFNESMDPTHDQVPAIAFIPDVTSSPQTLDIDTYGWSASDVANDTLRWSIDVIDEDQDVDAVAIDVFGGRDAAGNDLMSYAQQIEFEIDMLNPTLLTLYNVSGGAIRFWIEDSNAGGVIGFGADFSEEMDPNANPTLTFSPDITRNPILTLEHPTCVWWGEPVNQRVATIFDVVDRNVDVPDVSVRVTDARDSAGNPMETYTLDSCTPIPCISVDTLNPTVAGVSVGEPLIDRSDRGGTFTVTVYYSEPIKTGMDPAITFDPALDAALSPASGAWLNATTYEATYDIGHIDVAVSGVDVLVDGATDVRGNAQVAYVGKDLFDIETESGPRTIVMPTRANGETSFLDRCLDLEEGEEPPMVGSRPLGGHFNAGETVTGDLGILDADGKPCASTYIIVTLYAVDISTDPEGMEPLDSWNAHYAPEEECYRFEVDTTGLAPGIYDLRLGFEDGSTAWVRVEVAEEVE